MDSRYLLSLPIYVLKSLRKAFCGLSCLLLVVSSSLWAAEPIKVTMINPDPPGDPFWDQVVAFMQASAEDLNIDLKVLHSRSQDRFKYLEIAKEEMESDDRPDYLVAILLNRIGPWMLKSAEENGVKVLTINTDVSEQDNKEIGAPRGKYKNWIAKMYPDDKYAGYLLGKKLIERAKLNNDGSGKTIEVVAVTGGRATAVAEQRVNGLRDAIKENPQSKLVQVVYTDWTSDMASQKTASLMRRYPNISVAWAASDFLSFGALAGVKAHNQHSSDHVVSGGIDWTNEGKQAVANKKMTTTVGGHFMEGGWALVLIHDYHNGRDFNETLGLQIRTKMSALDETNIGPYLQNFGKNDWKKIDFKQFSKVYNPKVKRYQFNLENVKLK